jgi:hypothetical protein
LFSSLALLPSPSHLFENSTMSPLLAGLESDILDYAKSMHEARKAKDLDFEIWKKEFCEKMVRLLICMII